MTNAEATAAFSRARCPTTIRGTITTRQRSPIFHPLNHLSIAVEKGDGAEARDAYRHVGPPSSLAEYARRIIMRAQLRDDTYTFFKTTAMHLRHEGLYSSRIFTGTRACPPRRPPEASRYAASTTSFMATRYRPPIKPIPNGLPSFPFPFFPFLLFFFLFSRFSSLSVSSSSVPFSSADATAETPSLFALEKPTANLERYNG